MTFRAVLAVLLCKTLRMVSRILRRGGTAMPGRFALKICPGLLSVLSKDVKTVAITGTNGKTTGARMIEEALTEAGYDCFSNRSGANLISGIVTEFVMNCTLGGKMKKHTAVIECDEAAAKTVFRQMQPAVIVVTNLFNDQLDRYGTVEHTLSYIREGIQAAPNAVLVLNGDCPLCASLAQEVPNRSVFFGMDNGAMHTPGKADLSAAKNCIRCGTPYEFTYINYGHLGGFRCPGCGYQRREPEFAITDVVEQSIRGTTVVMNVPGGNRIISIPVAGLYNAYNAAAALAAAVMAGADCETAIKALESVKCGFGRMESFKLGASGATMMLVKNAIGCNQAIDFLKNVKEHFTLVLDLNNRVSDGTDISWINDADFETLLALPTVGRVFVSGERVLEAAERLRKAGIAESRMTAEPDRERLVSLLEKEEQPIFMLPNYTAMLELRETVVKHTGGKSFWEG